MTAGIGSFLEVDWPEKARLLAERLPVSVLHREVVRWLEGSDGDGRVGIACSGGADSVCLLLMLWAHFPDLRARFRVLHFDHDLRGEASKEDAAFVVGLAAGLRLDSRVGRWERGEEIRVNEATAREARFSFFYRELLGDQKVVCLGHNRDDIVESQLMRLSRGSGVAGLAAPRPVQLFRDGRVHLRPLLDLPGEEIRRVLAELAIPFSEDLTNEEPCFYRNRIRREVLPLWQEKAPSDVAAGASASRQMLQEDDEALEMWLRENVEAPVPGQPYDLSALKGKPRALLRRALRAWTVAEGIDERLSRSAFDGLLRAAEAGRACKISVGSEDFLELSRGLVARRTRVRRLPTPLFDDSWLLPGCGEIFLPGGRSLRAQVLPLDRETKNRILSGRIDCRAEAFIEWPEEDLKVRHREAGDAFRPLGAPGSRKVQDLFVDKKIPEVERHSLPVVFVGGQIVWVPHFPPAEHAKVKSFTKTVVRLTYSCVRPV